MKLYVNGCSFSSGTQKFPNTDNLINWGFYLQDNFETVINESIEGGSNHRLFRQATEFINNTDNLDDWIFILQLTSPERTEVFHDTHKAWIGVIKDAHFTEDRILFENTDIVKEIENFFQRLIMPTIFMTRTLEEGIFETYNMLNTFIELCKHKNIKFLITGMSNKCMPNVFSESGCDNQPFNGLDFPVFDKSNFILPVSNITINHKISEDDKHPNKDGHIIFARYILNEIGKRWQI